jgi:CRISPR-associated endonuclease/helicase Cas3
MNVLIISQCSKRALTETRRILDQFAERKGERTWQTAITMQGLETLRRVLRKTARRNTAVACHWIRGRNHSELLWIVGDVSQFNSEGAVPTNITLRDVLRAKDENDWHTAEVIRLVTSLAALFHDFGKATKGFQDKLITNEAIADPLRHEWISVRLLEAFVNGEADEAWLQRLESIAKLVCDSKFFETLMENIQRDGLNQDVTKPFKQLEKSPLAQFLAWLILSHHRLPVQQEKIIGFNSKILNYLPNNFLPPWNSSRSEISDKKAIEKCWRFPNDLPFSSADWQKHASQLATKILQKPLFLANRPWTENPHLAHLSRLCLMLADHYYSSLPASNALANPEKAVLYANTDCKTGRMKQRLDEHLIGVASNSARIMRILPHLENLLPRIARHKGFKRRSALSRFQWQDKAYDVAVALREKSSRQGFFGVNMASTGCGKTLANGRIMYGLSNPAKGARFTIALGLRVLTLQTGEAYRERLGLGPDDLAVLVGESAVRQLFEISKNDSATESNLQNHGSESLAELLPDNSYVRFEGSVEDNPLSRWLEDSRGLKSLVHAPILVSTIDHIIPATESTRGGHQIAPMLRLLTSDLVLDEPDDFGLEDLPALTRLVHWAGMLGSRLLLSSATLPPALIQGLFNAYAEGRKVFHLNRGTPGQSLDICCAWFDEHTSTATEHREVDLFMQTHRKFVEKRLTRLSQAEVRRKAVIVDVTATSQRDEIVHKEFARKLLPMAYDLHRKHHTVDPHTGKKVSFGLIRMANIDPLFDVARELLEVGADQPYFIHLCPYHSRHPLLVRSSIEQTLDRWLNRNMPNGVFEEYDLQQCLKSNPEPHQIFIVLATAVAEVGRDHDYDWAIVEPSSMRSIIQLAGRVKRHRLEPCHEPNIYLLNTNIKALKGQSPAFCHPGFENKGNPLESHRLQDILRPEDIERIDATPRIQSKQVLQPAKDLVDLEHFRLAELMLGQTPGAENPVTLWWDTPASLCGELQRVQPFRKDTEGRQRFVLQPDEEMTTFDFMRLEPQSQPTQQNNLFEEVDFQTAARIGIFGIPDYLEAVESFSQKLNTDPLECARRFGIIDLGNWGVDNGWFYHRYIGMRRRK